MAKKKIESEESLEELAEQVLSEGQSEEESEVEETSSAETEDEEVVESTDESSEEEQQQSTKVKVGDTEYDIDELHTLVEKGKFAKQVESEQNIDLSRVYPEFTKRSQLLKNPEALKQYVKENYGVSLTEAEPQMSDEERALKEQIEIARQAGFLVKEDTQGIVKQVMDAIEIRELGRAVDSAVDKHKVDRLELIDFMSYLNTRDADDAAQKLTYYKQVASGKPPAQPKEIPTKPEVLKTETKGTGGRATPKPKAVPHPDKDPEGFERRIMEFLERKSPEEA